MTTTKTRAMKTVLVKIADLNPAPYNPRKKIDGHQRDSLKASLKTFGAVEPAVVNADGTIIGGHQRVDVASELGWTDFPVVRVDVTDEEARALNLALNQIRGEWDDTKLASVLGDLIAADFDLAVTGFGDDEVKRVLAAQRKEDTEAEADDVPSDVKSRTKRGDIWTLGSHRLMCGDSREADDVKRLLNGANIDIAFTSPPYATRRKYDEGSGFLPIRPDDYVEWFEPIAANVALNLADKGSWFVNLKPHAEDGQRVLYVMDLVLTHARDWGWKFVDELAWLRSGVPGRWNNRLKNGWEPVFHFSLGEVKVHPEASGTPSEHAFRYGAGIGRSVSGSGLLGNHADRTSVARSGVALPSNVVTVGSGGASVTGKHPAEYPVGLPAWFIRVFSDTGAVVFDPFMGSGSTMIAAEQERAVSYGMELSPGYCDIAIQRWEDLTGGKAVKT